METIHDLIHNSQIYQTWKRYLILLTLLALAACVMPGATTPIPVEDTQEPTQANPAYTAAAETIIAQLTALAPTETGEAPAVRATLTDTPIPSVDPSTGGESPSTVEATTSSDPPSPAVETISPEASQTPELTSTPTSPAPPTPTPASNDPRVRLGEPDWRDTFANANNWPLFEDEHVHFRLRDGGLQMLAKKPEKWDGWMLSWTTLFNFYLEVTASPQNCSGGDRYGMLARAPSAEEAYLFGFTCDGRYALRKWDGKRFTYLIDWTDSSLINKGEGKTNRLGFMASGDQLSLYANGELLTEVNDRSFADGAFGLFISSLNTENFKVMVSEVAYWELP